MLPTAPVLPAVLDETKLTTNQAAKLLHTTSRSVLRWADTGCTLSTGESVRLEGVRAGTRFTTSREAVARFLANLETARNPPPVAKNTADIRRAQKAIDRLRKKGFRV